MPLRFVQSENTFSYVEALDMYLAAHGRPVAFYSDKNTVFRVAEQDKAAPKNAELEGKRRATNPPGADVMSGIQNSYDARSKRPKQPQNMSQNNTLPAWLFIAAIYEVSALPSHARTPPSGTFPVARIFELRMVRRTWQEIGGLCSHFAEELIYAPRDTSTLRKDGHFNLGATPIRPPGPPANTAICHHLAAPSIYPPAPPQPPDPRTTRHPHPR